MNSFYYIIICWMIMVSLPCKVKSQDSNREWSNPVRIHGSSFGHVFQGYFKMGNYEMLLQLTSRETRNKYSNSTILKYYQQMQFAYPIKLISMKRKDGHYILNYTTNVWATESIVSMKFIVELDTCRIVLPSDFLQQKYFLLW